jgi:hypothetical protein
LPRYWLSGEEKKLLWKLRDKGLKSDSGDYWRHLIPRNEKELNFLLSIIPDNAVEQERANESFSWKERQTRRLPDGTRELRDIIYTANLKTSLWYFEILHPFTIQPLPEGLDANQYESKEWIPQVFDISNKTWRQTSQRECENWNDLVNCPSCNHPTFPQFECHVCGARIVPPLKEIEKRVLSLICILPDTTDWLEEEEQAIEKPESEEKEEEPTELEEVIEETVSEEVVEREEDEETKDIPIS